MEAITRHVYYQDKICIKLPPNPQWRYWKFHLPNGKWRFLRGIANVKELRDLLVKYNPEAFYYSTSEFLNTERPEKANYQIAEQLFLDSRYLVIDIDNLRGYHQVKESSMEVLNRMRRFSTLYKFDGVIFTGRGVRLEFQDLSPRPHLLPNEKEAWLKRTRKQFCLRNLSSIDGFDDIIAWDTRRVIKGIGSPNPHNNHVTEYVSDIQFIPAIPGKVNDATGGSRSPSLQEQERTPERGLGYSPTFPMYFGKFIRSKVEGTKDRFVPFFTYYKKYKHWQKDLKFLQERYGLSNIYVMDDDIKIMAISVDAVPAPRLDKIYVNSKSLVKNMWAKFHNLYIRTSSFFNQDLKKIKEYELKPLFLMTASAHKMFPISRPHIDFLNYIGFNTENISDRVTIGKEKNTIYESYFEKRKFD